MKYMGSKNRHAKEILSIILKDRKENDCFVDLFCGGANIVDKVSGNRIANDINFYLIELLKALQNGWIPPKSLSEEEYNDIRQNKEKYAPELVGFVGFPCSYAAKFFGGYCRGKDNKGNPRSYIMEAWRNCMNQAPNLKGIQFYNTDYFNIKIPENSICYCDIPYQNSTKYKNSFDHTAFWAWAQEKSKYFNLYVSEYSAPENWECLWQKEVFNSLTKETGAKIGVEKLFKYKG